MKLVWALYALLALVVLVPLGWGLTVKLSAVLAEGPASIVGYGGAAVFLGLPFIVLVVRTRARRSR